MCFSKIIESHSPWEMFQQQQIDWLTQTVKQKRTIDCFPKKSFQGLSQSAEVHKEWSKQWVFTISASAEKSTRKSLPRWNNSRITYNICNIGYMLYSISCVHKAQSYNHFQIPKTETGNLLYGVNHQHSQNFFCIFIHFLCSLSGTFLSRSSGSRKHFNVWKQQKKSLLSFNRFIME